MSIMPQTERLTLQELKRFEAALFDHALELLRLHRKVLGGYDVDWVTEAHAILERGAGLAQIAGGLTQLARVRVEATATVRAVERNGRETVPPHMTQEMPPSG